MWFGRQRPAEKLRVAAYAVCVDDGKVLLARGIEVDGPRWTVPGGGIAHAEDPLDAAIREVEEETGYVVAIERLLGVNSIREIRPRAGRDKAVDFHGLRILYSARVVGGELRDEVGGSTDKAAWVDIGEVPALNRVDLVDIALDMHGSPPADGRGRTGP